MIDVASFLHSGLGIWGYLFIFTFSFAESLAFVGLVVPGSIAVILAGALASQGVFNIEVLFVVAFLGAILGDSLSYYLGRRGLIKFNTNNKIFKPSVLEKGKKYFEKHGAKSVFFGRFIGWVRPTVPFIAGVFQLDRKTFLLWNITSAIFWAASHLAFGYFFGGVVGVIGSWATRAGFFAVIAIILIFITWFILKRSKLIVVILFSIVLSIKNAVISNPDVRKLIDHHPHFFTFIKRRFNKKNFSGLPLTIILVSFVYVLSLFLGIVEDVVTSDVIVAADIHVAHLFFAFRDMELITFFTWVTLLGGWEIIITGVVIVSILLWLWHKRLYILPLWITLVGSELFNLLGKLAFHRPRPDVAYYVERGFSFPSGHATIAVAFYGFLTYVFLCNTKTWSRKVAVLLWGIVVILAIGLSRLYLGVHYISDVWGGYLSGVLFLIIGIALVEWLKHRQLASVPIFISNNKVRIISGVLILAQMVFYITFAIQYNPPINIRQIQDIEIVENVLTPFQQNQLSKFTETVLGSKQEPLDFIIVAKDDDEFINIMNRAGWRIADRTTPTSVLALVKSAIFNEPYPTAPITPSFWNTHPHDFGFEKQTAAQNVKERHHVRFWKTNMQNTVGEHVYVGTASFDSGIKWFLIHRISPDIDTERELLFTDLLSTGDVATSSKETFVAPVFGENFSGDHFFTDGNVYLIDLEK